MGKDLENKKILENELENISGGGAMILKKVYYWPGSKIELLKEMVDNNPNMNWKDCTIAARGDKNGYNITAFDRKTGETQTFEAGKSKIWEKIGKP